jgi:hypothetical protein
VSEDDRPGCTRVIERVIGLQDVKRDQLACVHRVIQSRLQFKAWSSRREQAEKLAKVVVPGITRISIDVQCELFGLDLRRGQE